MKPERNCICENNKIDMGCGDGWTICDGFCVTANHADEDRRLLIQVIDQLVKEKRNARNS